MGTRKEKFVDKTIVNTPKPMATSTVQKKRCPTQLTHGPSLILEDERNECSVSDQLQEQRYLAENSLQRLSNVAAIPSRYFKPNDSNRTRMSSLTNSTVSESDLLRTPANTSTPKSSIGRTSISQSVAQLSYKIKNTDISMDNFVKEFQKVMNVENKVDSIMFKPAEEAASMLLADELSWRRQNELPINENESFDSNFSHQTSIGEFFRQKSDTLSVFDSKSPPKEHKPIPLIESVELLNNELSEVKKNKTLSITMIQKCLQSEDTPRKAVDVLLKQTNEPNTVQNLLEKKAEKLSSSLTKNLSYTSDPSDDFLKGMFDKENIDTSNTSTKNRLSITGSTSPTSRSSSRALTSLPDGKLPIESTASELIWGCVKIDKCVTQEFSIRNRSSKRLGIQMAVTGHDYKIRKDNRSDADLLSSTKVILHPHESKVIIVSFIPTRVGACVDLLSFSALDNKMQQTKKQFIRLFGYGGYDKIDFGNLTKDITGKFWMFMGKFDNQGELTKKFMVENTGVLSSFVYINYNSKISCELTVQPNFFVLIPNEQKLITVKNIFTAQSFKMFQKSFNSSSVVDLGTLNITTGTEANRGRLQRLCRKLSEAGSPIDSLSNILKETIQGEVIPSDISKFKESTSALKNILEFFNKYEVVLTVERDPDQTILMQYPDESGLYHTLCETTSISVLDNTVGPTLCRLEPGTIILTPPSKVKDLIFLKSETNRSLQYQVKSESDGLKINPERGVINPYQEIRIYLNYTQVQANLKCFKIFVTVGNEQCECLVKIKLE